MPDAASVICVQEVEIQQMLSSHPNIIHLKEAFEDTSGVHLVLQLCTGYELGRYLVGRQQLTEKVIARLLIGILSALAYCHKNGKQHLSLLYWQGPCLKACPCLRIKFIRLSAAGILHRDVKFSNILVSCHSAKLADFGLAKILPTGMCFKGRAGTQGWQAPEVFNATYSFAADIWSAGVVFYVMLSGRLPFDSAMGEHSCAASTPLYAETIAS